MLVLKNILREFVLDIWNGPILRSAHTLYAHPCTARLSPCISPHTSCTDCRFYGSQTSTKLSF